MAQHRRQTELFGLPRPLWQRHVTVCHTSDLACARMSDEQKTKLPGPLLLPALPGLPEFAPVLGVRHFGHGLLLLLALLAGLLADQAAPRPFAQWRWMDIVGEGGMTLMVGVWLAYLRASRPAGPVSNWLCLGLACMLVGSYVDALDEFWLLPKAVLWDNWLESTLTPLGMLALTVGLHHWRGEQLALQRQLGPRERHFRDHRRIDALTQLADAGYMATQIELERRAGRVGTLLMLGWQDFASVARHHGLAEADRIVQSASLLLLLHLPQDALLCRYAGDRLVLLLPAASVAAGRLQAVLADWSYHLPDGEALVLPVQAAQAATDEDLEPQALLLQLLDRMR